MLIGTVAKYAIYAYALNKGVRAPAEGVEFLEDSIPLLSAALTLGISLAFYCVRSAFRLFFRLIHNTIFGYAEIPAQLRSKLRGEAEPDDLDRTLQAIADAPREFHRASAKRAIAVVATVAAAFGALISGIAAWNGVEHPMDQGAVVAFFILAAGLSLWREWVLAILAGIASLFFYVSTVRGAFDTESVGQFLKSTQYGGGIFLCVELMDRPEVMEIRLEVRTREALLGFDRVDGNPVDIPRHQVKNAKVRLYGPLAVGPVPSREPGASLPTTCD